MRLARSRFHAKLGVFDEKVLGNVVLFGKRFHMSHEVRRGLLQILPLDPLHATDALKEQPRHGYALEVHDVSSDTHPIDEGILQRNVVCKPITKTHGGTHRVNAS